MNTRIKVKRKLKYELRQDLGDMNDYKGKRNMNIFFLFLLGRYPLFD